jgi:uncharacterized protein (DUF885 family)
MREVRLVIDTGIHADGWSREPQALSYKIGQLEILKLRQRWQQELGSGFDIRQFHDKILSAGNLPLNILEARVNSWLATKHRQHARSRIQEN